MSEEYAALFEALKNILKAWEDQMIVETDTDTNYTLITHYKQANKKPLYFGAVRVNKSYVSYHLVPVYMCPDLLEGMSSALKARMPGKGCFNLKKLDAELIAEITRLTEAGAERYKTKEWL